MSGILYVVATPIGHLGDLSRRCVEVLSDVQIIAAEDTRRTGILLQHIGADRREVVSLHEHNEQRIAPLLLERVSAGEDMALVSDAGTPLINDPGYMLLRLAWEAGIRVTPIPGPSAITTALSVCPLPCQPFRYVGFLPSKKLARQNQLQRWLHMPEAFVFFESPKRIRATLESLAALTERKVMLGREMTKQYETFLVGNAAELLEQLDAQPRGEFVGIVEVSEQEQSSHDQAQVLSILLRELPMTQAAKLAAAICGTRKKDAYDLAMQLPQSQLSNS